MTRSTSDELLLGEWACLGVLTAAPAHGFAIATRMAPTGDLGRIWSLSRPLTYRALAQLAERGLIEPVSKEPGIAGGTRTVFASTRQGRIRLDDWFTTPVEHLRDLRSELLLKIVLAAELERDISLILVAQRRRIESFLDELDTKAPDVVTLWRREAALGALRFLEGLSR